MTRNYAVWNDLRDTLEGYYKSKPRQHNSLSQQKEFRAIKNAIIQEAERLRLQIEEPSAQTSANPLLTDEHISSITSQFARLPSEYLLNSTVRLFHQMGPIASRFWMSFLRRLESTRIPIGLLGGAALSRKIGLSRTTMSRHRAMNKVCKS